MKDVTKKALKVHENGVKASKKAVKARIVENPPQDRDRLRDLTHLMLDKLETAIKLRKPKVPQKNKTEEEIAVLEKEAAEKLKASLEKLFGDKNSCLDSLCALSNLLLKLEQPAANPSMNAEPSNTSELAMNEADMALLQGFLGRVRS